MMVVTVPEVVGDTTFIRLKVPTRLTKTVKKKLNSGLMMIYLGKTLEIKVFNLRFDKFHFIPCSSNCF
jgi:hypothetical protein